MSRRLASVSTMATQKVSVTLEASAIERARRTAGPRGLSAYVDQALAEKLERDERRDALIAHLDELDAADPIPADAEKEGAERAAQIRASILA